MKAPAVAGAKPTRPVVPPRRCSRRNEGPGRRRGEGWRASIGVTRARAAMKAPAVAGAKDPSPVSPFSAPRKPQ